MNYKVIVLSFLFGFQAIGQEVKKDSITQLEEVILSVKKIANPVIGITTTDVIGATTFENYSPLDIASSINQVSGVYLLSGALNTNRITIRGIGARTPFGTDKLRLYYNEIPITNGAGFSTIEAFDIENLGSIEVIKGPKGSAYGSNLGGAILLQSRTQKRDGSVFTNNFTVGSYELLKNNLDFSHRDGDIDLSLKYGHVETDGYRENSRFERDALLLNTSYEINAQNKIELLVNFIDYSAQIPSSISRSAFDEDPTQAAFTWAQSKGFEANKYTLLGLTYSHAFSKKLENATSIFYSYLDHYEPRPFNILDEYTNGFGFRTNFTGNFTIPLGKTFYSFGSELYKDEYHWATFDNLYQDNNGNGSLKGDRISNNREFRRQLNVFGSVTLPLSSRLLIQAGFNINNTSYNFQDIFNTAENNKSAERDFKTIFLPNLDLSYAFSENHLLYANISKGFSNPSLEETLTPGGIINPDIAQETGINYELGTNLLLVNKRLQLKVAIYQMDIKNLLVAQRVGDDQFIGKNAGRTKHQGLELDINYRFKITSNLALSPFFSYTLNNHKFKEFVDGDNNYSGNPLTGVPKNKINSGVQLKHSSGFYWNTTLQFIDEIPLNDATTLYSEAFTLLNTRMGYSKEISRNFIFGIDFGMNNIGNIQYAQSVLINAVGFGGAAPRYYYPGNARNYYGSLQLSYKL
ncbi:TonB-dependent receptor family protein [Sediminicola arcticus]|jgi:iron complex outermembrane receptor protein|uniref:TonB-dependent receptor n=1 Tax=Sediminicola arcticus TaxID=1574308 RepID=A0ABV2SQ94_9FLAO